MIGLLFSPGIVQTVPGWFQGRASQSGSSACSDKKLDCVIEAMAEVTTEEKSGGAAKLAGYNTGAMRCPSKRQILVQHH